MNRYRLFKQLWNNRYPVRVWGKDIVPPVLKEKGIELVDPTVEKVPEIPEWQPPVPDDTRFLQYYPKKESFEDPNWHDTPSMRYTYPGQLLTGIKQSQYLTNTAIKAGLPAALTASENLGSENEDELIHRIILHSHKWFPGKDKLPKHFWPEFPKYKLRAEQGTLRQDILRKFLHNLLHHCTVTASCKTPEFLLTRQVMFDPQISASYNVKFGDNDIRSVLVCGKHAAAISSSDPLPVFAEKEMTTEIPGLYPISPFIDLEPEHIYPKDSNGWTSLLDAETSQSSILSYPHTLFLYSKEAPWIQADFEHELWTKEHYDARAIMFVHSWCVSYAKQMYGDNVKDLPKPLTAQCIQTDGEGFRFLCYQLNTLDVHREDCKVRNIAWIDDTDENELFLKLIQPKQFSREAVYTDYEPAVYNKFLSFFLNGYKNA